MTAKVVDIEALKPVWANGFARCPCGFHCVSTYHIESNPRALECAQCGRMEMALVSEAVWQKSRAVVRKPR